MKSKTNLTSKILMGLVFGAVSLGSSFEARATTFLNDPWGDSSTDAFVGYFSPDEMIKVYWIRHSDGACAVSSIGTSLGLFDNYQLRMLGGDDRIFVGGGYGFTCNGSQRGASGPIPLGGHFLDLTGGDGNDRINNTEGTNTWLVGDAGDDRLYSTDRTGWLLGQDGNDTLKYFSGTFFTATERLDGGEGHDCLDEAGDDQYAFYDCGNGWDKVAFGPNGNFKANCNVFNATCPGLFDP